MSITTEQQSPHEARPRTDERYRLGTIEGIIPVDLGPFGDARPGEAVMVETSDPYMTELESANPETVTLLADQERMMSEYAKARREKGLWAREPGTPYKDEDGGEERTSRFYGDPVSQSIHFNGDGYIADPAIVAWRKTIPRASALLPLTEPAALESITDRRGNLVPATDATREWMTVCTDAQGIRNRGTILAAEAYEAIKRQHEGDPDSPVSMVSVGAGTLLPTLQAAVHSGIDSKINITMLEKDEKAIDMAYQLAEEIGFQGEITVKKINVFNPAEMEAVVEELEGSATTVDAVGLFEYINENLAKELIEGSELLRKPEEFMKLIYRMVGPGGRLIIGQMRDDRPNADFTMGVIGWPFIVMRSPKGLMQVTQRAGMDLSGTRLSFTPEGVYSMLSIGKSPEAPSSNGNGSHSDVLGRFAAYQANGNNGGPITGPSTNGH